MSYRASGSSNESGKQGSLYFTFLGGGSQGHIQSSVLWTQVTKIKTNPCLTDQNEEEDQIIVRTASRIKNGPSCVEIELYTTISIKHSPSVGEENGSRNRTRRNNGIWRYLHLHDLHVRLHDGDLVQLRLDGGGLNDPLFTVRKVRGGLNASDLMDNLANLMQSNAEIHLHGTLRLNVMVIRNIGGRGRSVISTLLHSQLVKKKRRFLVDLNSTGSNLCFGGGLLAVMAPQRPTFGELIDGARQLYRELGFSEDNKIMLSDVAAFERHFKVNITVILHGTKDWEMFRTGDPVHTQNFTYCFMMNITMGF